MISSNKISIFSRFLNNINITVKGVFGNEGFCIVFVCLYSQQKLEREDSHGRSKKRKKDKKKKRKKEKKSREQSGTSGSESDTVYPSDLLKQDDNDRFVHV